MQWLELNVAGVYPAFRVPQTSENFPEIKELGVLNTGAEDTSFLSGIFIQHHDSRLPGPVLALDT